MSRLPFHLAIAAACVALDASAGSEIVRCVDPRGAVIYQHGACPEATVTQRSGIPNEFPEPNHLERDRLFAREAALDRRLEARRDRELQEQQMREARAEREAERQRLAMLAGQQQPQYAIAYPLWRGYGPVRPAPHLPRYSGPLWAAVNPSQPRGFGRE